MNAAELVRTAFVSTKALAGEYIAKTIAQRAGLNADGNPNAAAAGSIYPGMTPAMIEAELLSPQRAWEEVIGHPEASAGTRVFKTEFAGESGMLRLSELPSETKVLLAAPAKGGNLFPLIFAENARTATPVTHVIIGVNDPEKPFFVTFHPGDLIARSEVTPEMVGCHWRLTTAEEVRNKHGFRYAKVVDRRTWLLECGLRHTECLVLNEARRNSESLEETQRLITEKLAEMREQAEKFSLWQVSVYPSAFDYKIGNTGSAWGYMLAPSEDYAKEHALYGGGSFGDMDISGQFDPRGGEVTVTKAA